MTRTALSNRAAESPVPLLVAEIGLNHNGDPSLAAAMLRAARAAGADAVKFQTFRADRLVADRKTGDFFRKFELPWPAYPELMALGRELGIIVCSTPFDEEAAEMLAGLGAPFIKIASGDLTHLPLLRHVGRLGVPVALATGMGTIDEIETALAAIGHRAVTLLQCTSAYPCPPEAVDLRAMVALGRRFGLPVGFSDHTEGIGAAVGAAVLGAVMIEKHFTSDRSLPGPDQKMSLDPAGWSAMTRAIREATAALGAAEKTVREAEAGTRAPARRSLVATRALPAGHTLTRNDLDCKRPGIGLPPAALESVIGRRLARAVAADRILGEDDLAP